MSMMKRFKKGMKRFVKGAKTAGTLAMPGGAGIVAGKMLQDRLREKALDKGMAIATGKDPETAKKIKQRVDIAAMRLSAKRRAAGEKPRYGGKKKK
jgi:hypothetical protein